MQSDFSSLFPLAKFTHKLQGLHFTWRDINDKTALLIIIIPCYNSPF